MNTIGMMRYHRDAKKEKKNLQFQDILWEFLDGFGWDGDGKWRGGKKIKREEGEFLYHEKKKKEVTMTTI